ncbi:MAG: trypsin-like peptidase domain-containing protein [Patescibacteria group bacterium]|nr:trypsin-like peptidase domain-containing protein [Patescibacteria group bacterium]
MLSNSSNNLIVKVIKKIIPATVTIAVSKNFQEIKKEALKENKRVLQSSQLKKLKAIKESADGDGMVRTSSGSGFIIDSSGIILSNRHVINDSLNKYTVITNSGDKYDAEIVARDPISDLAILKINSKKKLPFIKLGNSLKLELGETVIAIGNALGIFQNTVSSGIVSGLSRSITAQVDSNSPIQEIHGLIQTDTAINPGNSGGPLVNLKGEAIGINIAIILGAENISFALPINIAKRDLEDLKKFGKIKRPFLGVHYLLINDGIKNKYKLPVNYGALITSERPYSPSVADNSPASKAGLRGKDIILECNGVKVSEQKTIGDIMETCSVGDALKITVLRKGKKHEFRVVLSERK